MLPLRGPRLLILLAIVLITITLYTFYPVDPFRKPHSPDEAYDHYEQGGIDSDHYGPPIVPDFEDEEECREGGCAVDGLGLGAGGRSVGDNVRPGHAAGHDVSQTGGEEMDEETRSGVDDEGQEVFGGSGATVPVKSKGHTASDQKHIEGISEDVLSGGVIMPKLENATAKAELGRAAWRVMHLMTLRYPEHPTPEDRSALKSYFHLFSRLYPCGECAEEFQKLLKTYPPQTSSRKTASMWLCTIHNIINDRLGKPEFDCLTLNDVYDCGCGPEGESVSGDTALTGGSTTTSGAKSESKNWSPLRPDPQNDVETQKIDLQDVLKEQSPDTQHPDSKMFSGHRAAQDTDAEDVSGNGAGQTVESDLDRLADLDDEEEEEEEPVPKWMEGI